MTPVISVTGWSGSGKTRFIERLIPRLLALGLRPAVIKHDGHDFQMDKEGKDTWRFTKAGAVTTAILNDRHAAILDNRPVGLERLIGYIHDADIIITEGFDKLLYPQIEVFRSAVNPEMRTSDFSRLIAVVSDEALPLAVPRFSPEDVSSAARFIADYAAGAAEAKY